MIKDWKEYRKRALELVTKSGLVTVFGSFSEELEEVVFDCILQAMQVSKKEVTFLINSNGGATATFDGIYGLMTTSGINFTGIVLGRARSNGFNLLQACSTRLAVVPSVLMFHWGKYTFDNAQLHALFMGETWPTETAFKSMLERVNFMSSRMKISPEALMRYAQLERDFSAWEGLELGMLDRILPRIPQDIKLDM